MTPPRGSVTLLVEGLMLEKLLNRALEDGAEVIHAQRTSRREMLIELDAKSAKKLRALAQRYSMTCIDVCESGLTALINRLRARWTAVFAFGVMAALTALFLSRIWITDVRVIGGAAPTETVLAEIARAGVKTGASAADIDTESLAVRLVAAGGYSYASVSREGVSMIIELREEAPAPDLYDIGYARDLVAACDAVIVEVNVKSGTAMVAAGDTVRRGQVLISGSERVTKEETRSVGALGSVTARIWCEGKSDGKTVESVKSYTGRESVSTALVMMDYDIPLTSGEKFTVCDSETRLLPVGGLFLPAYIERTELREYEIHEKQADTEQLKNALQAQAMASAEAGIAATGLQNTEIIDKWTDFSMIDTDTLRARAVIELHAEIAVTREYMEGN